MTGPDQFTETAILYAVMNDDPDRARELLADMTESELTDLYNQVSRTIDLTAAELRRRVAARGPGQVV